jgi:hypothetical protein
MRVGGAGGHRGSGSSALGKAQLWEERQLAMLSYLQQHTTVNLAGVDTLSVLFDECQSASVTQCSQSEQSGLAGNCLCFAMPMPILTTRSRYIVYGAQEIAGSLLTASSEGAGGLGANINSARRVQLTDAQLDFNLRRRAVLQLFGCDSVHPVTRLDLATQTRQSKFMGHPATATFLQIFWRTKRGNDSWVRRPFPSWNRSTSTEIYLCHACSCQEILRIDGDGRAGGHHPHLGDTAHQVDQQHTGARCELGVLHLRVPVAVPVCGAGRGGRWR